jgi:hypothetical protein
LPVPPVAGARLGVGDGDDLDVLRVLRKDDRERKTLNYQLSGAVKVRRELERIG